MILILKESEVAPYLQKFCKVDISKISEADTNRF
jgi:hypothetical protein